MENKVKTTISISPSLLIKGKEYAQLNTISFSTLVTLALIKYLMAADKEKSI